MRKLYVIESSVIGPSYLRAAAQRLGLELTFLSRITNQEGDALCQLLQGRVLQCDTEDPQGMAQLIREDADPGDVAGVMTFLDSRLVVCAEVCRTLGVKGLDPTVGAIKSKAVVNELIPEYVPRSLHFDARLPPVAALQSLQADARHGLIVKPAYAAGAKGYREIPRDAELLPATQWVDEQLSAALRPFDLVVQEKKLGELVSIEGFVARGKVCFLGSTGRRKVEHSESVFIFPYDNSLEPRALARAKAAIVALVERSGLEHGFFHTEFIVDGGDASLIDANFGRPGGANLVEVFSFSYGIEPDVFYELALSINLFHCVPPGIDWERPVQPGLGIAYGLPTACRLLGYEAPAQLASRHTRAQNSGCTIDAMGTSNWAWVGLLAGSPRSVRSDLEGLRLKTALGTVAPAWYGSFDFHEAL
jgi:hypothetical protein